MKTTIRPAAAHEADELSRIAHAAKRYWQYPDELMRQWTADLTVTAEVLARQTVYCAERAGRVAGFYALSGEGDRRELEHMWVDPACIGTGVGRQLFQHLLETLRAQRVAQLRIASDPHAEGFYRRMGARRIGSVPSTPMGRTLPLLELALRPRPAGVWGD